MVDGGVGLADRPKHLRQRFPCPRCLVGSAHLLPVPAGFSQLLPGEIEVSDRRCHPAAGVGGAGPLGVGGIGVGDRRELIRTAASGVDISGAQRGLGRRGKQPGAPQWIAV